jgi:hypothetical protein
LNTLTSFSGKKKEQKKYPQSHHKNAKVSNAALSGSGQGQ